MQKGHTATLLFHVIYVYNEHIFFFICQQEVSRAGISYELGISAMQDQN